MREVRAHYVAQDGYEKSLDGYENSYIHKRTNYF